jgi:hypothetical protein
MPQGSCFLGASPSADVKTLKDAKAELKELFDQYGQVDDGSTWSYLTSDKVTELKGAAENVDGLKDEDLSFFDADDECALWLSNDQSPTAYMIPLGKLRASIDVGAQCEGNCSAEMILHTKDNERAIKQIRGVRNAQGVIWRFNLTNENEAAPGLSGQRPLDKAINDVRVGIKACQNK